MMQSCPRCQAWRKEGFSPSVSERALYVERRIFRSFAQAGTSPKTAGTHCRGAKFVTTGTTEPG